MGKALKIKAEEMKELTEEMWQFMRINYYHLVRSLTRSSELPLTPMAELSPFSCKSMILKVFKYIPINPLPNAFVVNIADMLEMISNGKYKSIKHRATVNCSKKRLSIATFHSPRYEYEVGHASSLITKESPPLYTRITVQDYFKSLFSRQLLPKSHLQTLRIQHPQP
ncbi:2-oxoglutarate (2OG) and Fe(II)-dependent oxygenase superfamily protein [Euphorbia peplus]|nr:2-oxoglutarate (2OG) and Fe(II)-dependent oxygenase superfamily protein [Euphorbia peplus]